MFNTFVKTISCVSVMFLSTEVLSQDNGYINSQLQDISADFRSHKETYDAQLKKALVLMGVTVDNDLATIAELKTKISIFLKNCITEFDMSSLNHYPKCTVNNQSAGFLGDLRKKYFDKGEPKFRTQIDLISKGSMTDIDESAQLRMPSLFWIAQQLELLRLLLKPTLSSPAMAYLVNHTSMAKLLHLIRNDVEFNEFNRVVNSLIDDVHYFDTDPKMSGMKFYDYYPELQKLLNTKDVTCSTISLYTDSALGKGRSKFNPDPNNPAIQRVHQINQKLLRLSSIVKKAFIRNSGLIQALIMDRNFLSKSYTTLVPTWKSYYLNDEMHANVVDPADYNLRKEYATSEVDNIKSLGYKPSNPFNLFIASLILDIVAGNSGEGGDSIVNTNCSDQEREFIRSFIVATEAEQNQIPKINWNVSVRCSLVGMIKSHFKTNYNFDEILKDDFGSLEHFLENFSKGFKMPVGQFQPIK